MISAAPSREFLVRQAVMNAVWNEYPIAVRYHLGSIAGVLRGMRADEKLIISANLIVAVTREFHKLEKRFERAA